jgi:3-isopropylmalate/(R)-2-methylmalate dehydratase small subunit
VTGDKAVATKLRGKAWRFEGLLDVDWEIMPHAANRHLQEKGTPTYEDYGKYCMTAVDPDFPSKVQKGDFIIAGEGMGYGHDHDQACMSIRGAGVSAVLCEWSNPNFLRNSIDVGLPVIQCKGIMGKVRQGDELEVDLVKGTITNLTKREQMRFLPFPDFILEVLEAGGLYPHLKKQIEQGKVCRPGSVRKEQPK